MSIEDLARPEILGLIIAVLSVLGGGVAWLLRRRRRVRTRNLIDEVDDIYSRFKMNSRRCEVELFKLKDMALENVKTGKIDESHYDIVKQRIDEYIHEIREDYLKKETTRKSIEPKPLLTKRQIAQLRHGQNKLEEALEKVKQRPQIIKAAEKGNMEQVKTLLKQDPNLINVRDGFGCTPLHSACSGGHIEVVKLLLSQGAKVDAMAEDRSTPFSRAVGSVHANKEVVKLLLSQGVDVNNVNAKGSTPLHSTAGNNGWSGRSEIVKLLIEKGAEVNTKTFIDGSWRPWDQGETPLHTVVNFDALKLGNSVTTQARVDAVEVVKILLDHGADFKTKTSKGFTALQLAEKNHYPKVAELLRKHGDTLDKTIEPRTEPAKPVKRPPKTIRHTIGISESPEIWAERLRAKKDFRPLAAINNSKDYNPAFQKFKKRDIANQILIDAGTEAVDAIIQELNTEGVGSYDLANLLVRIGDPKSVPILKKKLDRGIFSSYNPSNIEHFIKEHQNLIGDVEMVTCALCGKTRPVTETQLFYNEGRQVKRFCKDTCWQKRGRVLKSGIGTACPFYSEGMCTAGNGDSLCSLKAGSYFSCHVYGIYK